MPLIKGKSKKSFKKNVETEMHAGKPQDQALAIAYSMQRRAKKKIAMGGMADEMDAREMHPKTVTEAIRMKMDAQQKKHKKEQELEGTETESMMAKGGMAHDLHDDEFAEGGMYAEGGEVDLQDNENSKNLYAKAKEYKKDTYFDMSQVEGQPENSNEDGRDLSDEDEYGASMLASIMKKMRSKRS